MDNTRRPGRGLHFLDLVAIVLRRWRLVLLAGVGTTLVAIVVSLLMPATYIAGTVLVPFPGAQSRTQLSLGQLPAGMAGLLGGGGSTSERLIGVILDSRTLADSLLSHVGGGPETQAEVHRILAEGTRIQRNPDGSILVQIRSRDPQLAARVANAYPGLINDLLAWINSQAALRKQEFLQAQLTTAREKLVQSEQQVLNFQQRRDAPDLQEQASRTLQAAAALQERIFQQELAVAQLRRTATPNNPELRAAMAELDARKTQLRRLTSGGAGGGSVFVPIGAGPELKVAATRLMREFTKDEQVYQSLTAALAEAQIDANNDLPVLNVLDEATVPGRPTGSLPRTALFAAALGLILGLVAAFVSEALHRIQRTPDNEQFFAAWDRFRADVGRLFSLPLRSNRRTGLSAGD